MVDGVVEVAWGIDQATGLPEYPPLTYEDDGNPRYRFCRYCRRWLPLATSFRRLVRPDETPFARPGVYRSRRCKVCDRELLAAGRREILAASLDEILAAEDCEQVLGICQAIAAELPGGSAYSPEKLVGLWRELIHDPRTSTTAKLKALQAWQHMVILAEQERIAGTQALDWIDPMEFGRRLADCGQLGAFVRICLAEGLLTWKEIDPLPGDWDPSLD